MRGPPYKFRDPQGSFPDFKEPSLSNSTIGSADRQIRRFGTTSSGPIRDHLGTTSFGPIRDHLGTTSSGPIRDHLSGPLKKRKIHNVYQLQLCCCCCCCGCRCGCSTHCALCCPTNYLTNAFTDSHTISCTNKIKQIINCNLQRNRGWGKGGGASPLFAS